jgi:uncharacterized protein (TIGR03435 family)
MNLMMTTNGIAAALLGTLLTLNCAFGQAAAVAPSFEVASIKPAAPMNQGMIVMGGDPGRINYTNVSLKAIMLKAYGVTRYQITGPSWIDSERYDVVAKVPENTPKEQIPAMLQALLAERFRLKTHRETKDMPVYALVAGKNGPKLKKVDDDTRAYRGMMKFSAGHLDFEKASMATFAEMLSNLLDHPVLDMTGLQGSYKFALDFSMDDLQMRMGPGGPGGGPGEGIRRDVPAPADGHPAPSIFTAIQQLGLRLESRKAPLEFLVVDDGNKIPTEN